VDPPGDCRSDGWFVYHLGRRLKARAENEPDANNAGLRALTWDYPSVGPHDEPDMSVVLGEINGKRVADGAHVGGFAELAADGSTACGCWIYAGVAPEAGVNRARERAATGPYGQGWGWVWPADRRILYNRASADPAGKPWDPERKLIGWNGQKWVGADVPDFKADSPPGDGMNPFIMNPEGVARFFALDKMAEGPFPEHYEPMESPLSNNPLHPDNPLATSNPAARVFKDDKPTFGSVDEFPYVCTTYRLTEHFHYWTKHAKINAVLQPEQFVEIGEELAKEKGIAHGDRVRLWSKRGEIRAVAVVTKRLKALDVEGKKVHQVGVPIHWGFKGVARKGYLANTLTPFVGDANTQTPEFKAFLVNVAKA